VSTTLNHAIDRLRAFLDELSHVAESEFPYIDSKEALTLLQGRFQDRLVRLQGLDAKSNPAVVRQECALALQALFIYLPLLGFILRSTNVRNAFEGFGPLLRLSRNFLDTAGSAHSATRLLLSSEWDYSPLSYPEIPELPGFVLIGLPASESSNPLLIPLAGHELGHAKWVKANLESTIRPKVFDEAAAVVASRWSDFQQCFNPPSSGRPADLTTDLYLLGMWQDSVAWALLQTEETFCDCVALGIFGRAYLEAFSYLLAPSHLGTRTVTYPPTKSRVTNLLEAATAYGVDAPADYALGFDDEPQPSLSQADRFRLEVADEALTRMIPFIVGLVADLLKQANIKLPEESEVARIVGRYRLVVPAETTASLPAILNAAWRVTNDAEFWKDVPQISANKRHVLKELVLKNAEIFEIEHILST
jgi:hypothetical protein